MTTIPRRRIHGTDLERVALLYRDVSGTWRYRFRDRNVPISPVRARRILQIARRLPGARVDPADVLAELDAVIESGANDEILRKLARGDDEEETTA